MDWTSLILLAGWGAVCNVWGFLLYAQRRARQQGVMLTPEAVAGGGRDTGPGAEADDSVCIIIPARDEADTIGASLASVLSQDYPRLSAVVIDDRSSDGTGNAARRVASTDARLRVQTIDNLPPGWLGKSHALWTATRGLETDWLLFIDADCTLLPGAVRTAIAEAHRRDVAILSLWPRHLGGSFWEHVLIPLCAAVMALWFSRSNNAGPSGRGAFANGQFILIRRDAYERIGGHRAVRRALIEDVPLAEHAARKGLRCWTAGGRDLVGVRMYKDFAGVADGWSRIFVGALRSKTRLLLSVAWLLVGSLLPFVACPILLYRLFNTSGHDPLLWAAAITCLTHIVLIYVVSIRFWNLGHCDRRYLLLYPLSVILVVGLLVRATWWLSLKRVVGWRNTFYHVDNRAMIIEQ